MIPRIMPLWVKGAMKVEVTIFNLWETLQAICRFSTLLDPGQCLILVLKKPLFPWRDKILEITSLLSPCIHSLKGTGDLYTN